MIPRLSPALTGGVFRLRRPPIEAALIPIVGPGLLTALALEHADGAPANGIQHCAH
jgi:hypothetical protein